MKLLSKVRDGKKVRRVYDPAKTPLQRLHLSGILSDQKQQELLEVANALDPIRLFQQVALLQQAVFRSAANYSPFYTYLHLFRRTLFSGKAPCRGDCTRSGSKSSFLIPRAGAEKTCAGLATYPERPICR